MTIIPCKPSFDASLDAHMEYTRNMLLVELGCDYVEIEFQLDDLALRNGKPGGVCCIIRAKANSRPYGKAASGFVYDSQKPYHVALARARKELKAALKAAQ